MIYKVKQPVVCFKSTTNEGFKTKVYFSYWEEKIKEADDVVEITTIFFAPKEVPELNNFKKIKTFSKHALFYKKESIRLNTINRLFEFLNKYHNDN